MEISVILSSNGKIKGVPNIVYMDIFNNKHLRELSIAYMNEDSEIFEMAVTSCLDSVINFEKTGLIKTSDELPSMDRLKLFLIQMLNCNGEYIRYEYECEKDGRVEYKFNIMNMVDNKLKYNVEEVLLDEKRNIRFRYPVRKDIIIYNNLLDEYRNKIYGEISSVYDKYFEINDSLKKELNVLKNKYYVDFDIYNLKSVDDIRFDVYTMSAIIIFLFLKTDFGSLEDYIEWFYNESSPSFVKKANELINKYNYGYSDTIQVVCNKCNKKDNIKIMLSPKFFFQVGIA